MSHTPREFSAFLGEEVAAFVYARRIDDGSIYFLPEDEGAVRRPIARAELECLFPDCPTPRLTSAHRAKKRDGFVHLSGSNVAHPAEDSFHYQAQVRIQQWLEAKHPAPAYATAMELQTDAARTRVADVMVERERDGKRVAFEVQYASLSPDDWAARHRDYEDMGIADIWVFGHRRAMKPRFDDEWHVKLGPTHEAVADAGSPVLWVNPVAGLIGIAVVVEVFDGVSYEVLATAGRASVVIETLDVFSLAEVEGVVELSSPTLRRLRAARAALDSAVVAKAEAERVAAEVARKEWLRRFREGEQRNREQAAEAAARADANVAWLASEEGLGLRVAFEDDVPLWIGVEVGDLPGLARSSAEWQGTLYLAHVHGRAPGSVVRVLDCVRTLGLGGAAMPVVRGWFERLVRWGVVGHAQAGPDASYRVASLRGAIVEAERVEIVVRPSCSACGHPLADIYLEAGRHQHCQVVKQRLRERNY